MRRSVPNIYENLKSFSDSHVEFILGRILDNHSEIEKKGNRLFFIFVSILLVYLSLNIIQIKELELPFIKNVNTDDIKSFFPIVLAWLYFHSCNIQIARLRLTRAAEQACHRLSADFTKSNIDYLLMMRSVYTSMIHSSLVSGKFAKTSINVSATLMLTCLFIISPLLVLVFTYKEVFTSNINIFAKFLVGGLSLSFVILGSIVLFDAFSKDKRRITS